MSMERTEGYAEGFKVGWDKGKEEALKESIPKTLITKPEEWVERSKLIEKAQTFNGQIKDVNDLFEHMERLQKCSICREDFYDKRCPSCIRKEKGGAE